MRFIKNAAMSRETPAPQPLFFAHNFAQWQSDTERLLDLLRKMAVWRWPMFSRQCIFFS
jgi:hypothetical protein